MKSPITYFGGKGTMFKKIIEYFPNKNEYEIYIEPFGGGYSIGLHMDYIPPVEIYNDLEENVYSLFKVLQDKDLFEKFKQLCDVTPFSEQLREEYIKQLKIDNKDISIVQRAFMFFYVNRTSRNGIGGFKVTLVSRRNMSKSVSDYLSTIDNLPELHQRLSHMIISHRDGISLIEKYGNLENVFIYADPPYVWETRTETRYKVDMDDSSQEEFVNACINAKCKILISGYDNKIYQKLEDNGFVKTEMEIENKSGTNKSIIKTECLWRNYNLESDNQNISGLF